MSVYMQRAYLYRYEGLNSISIYIDMVMRHVRIYIYMWLRPASCEHNVALGTLHKKDPAPIPTCGTLRDTRWNPGAANSVG